MIFLGFAWLVLLVLDLTRGLTPFLQYVTTGIWVIFIFEFLLRFAVAPAKLLFLKASWLTLIALAVPALRVFRIVRVVRVLRLARATRGLRLVRLVTSVNRGMSALRATLRDNRFGYVMGLSAIISFTAAAGMYALERPAAGEGKFDSYVTAVWWTAMMMTTMGADFFPQSPEGRFLALLVAVYAFAMWGYVTATIATFFLGRERQTGHTRPATAAGLEELRAEVVKLRHEIRQLSGDSPREPPVQG